MRGSCCHLKMRPRGPMIERIPMRRFAPTSFGVDLQTFWRFSWERCARETAEEHVGRRG